MSQVNTISLDNYDSRFTSATSHRSQEKRGACFCSCVCLSLQFVICLLLFVPFLAVCLFLHCFVCLFCFCLCACVRACVRVCALFPCACSLLVLLLFWFLCLFNINTLPICCQHPCYSTLTLSASIIDVYFTRQCHSFHLFSRSMLFDIATPPSVVNI